MAYEAAQVIVPIFFKVVESSEKDVNDKIAKLQGGATVGGSAAVGAATTTPATVSYTHLTLPTNREV